MHILVIIMFPGSFFKKTFALQVVFFLTHSIHFVCAALISVLDEHKNIFCPCSFVCNCFFYTYTHSDKAHACSCTISAQSACQCEPVSLFCARMHPDALRNWEQGRFFSVCSCACLNTPGRRSGELDGQPLQRRARLKALTGRIQFLGLILPIFDLGSPAFGPVYNTLLFSQR